MTSKLTPELAIRFTKITITLCCVFPLSKNASRFQVIRFKILQFLGLIHVIICGVSIVYTLFNNDYDLPRIIKLCCYVAPFIQTSWHIISFALQYDRLQYLIAEMEYNLKCAEAYEKEIYQQYVDKCTLFYMFSTIAVFFTAFASIIAPFVLPNQDFPLDVNYPFNVLYEPMRSIIYLHQTLVFYQTVSSVCLSQFIGLFIWFTTARFEILSHQLRKVSGTYDIIAGVRQHIKLMRYAQEVIIAVRSAILIVILVCTFSIVAAGLIIVSEGTFIDKAQFIILCIAGTMEVYAYAWPADYLTNASTNVANAIYECLWYNKDATFQRNVSFILFRSQIPIAVSVSSLLPVLSLNYFASYVSTTFSYLMTMRVALLDPQN